MSTVNETAKIQANVARESAVALATARQAIRDMEKALKSTPKKK